MLGTHPGLVVVDLDEHPAVERHAHAEDRADRPPVPSRGDAHVVQEYPERELLEVPRPSHRKPGVASVARLGVGSAQRGHVGARDRQEATGRHGLDGRVHEGRGGPVRVEVDDVELRALVVQLGGVHLVQG